LSSEAQSGRVYLGTPYLLQVEFSKWKSICNFSGGWFEFPEELQRFSGRQFPSSGSLLRYEIKLILIFV
jgi:hypothetical protein